MLEYYILHFLATFVLSMSGVLAASYFIRRYKKFDILHSFSIGSLVFVLFFLIYGTVLFFAGMLNRLTVIAPLIASFPFAFRFLKSIDKETKTIVILLAALFSIGVFIQIFLSYYPIGGDWFGHYKASSDFMNTGKIYFINGRPPIFNLLGLMYLELFSNNFWVFQIASVFLSSLFIIPLYLVAKEFNKKIAVLTIIFVILNSFILQNVVYTWPKNLTTFFVIFFFYFMMKNKSIVAMLPASLALYTSPVSLLFIPAGYVYGYFRKNKNLLKSIIILAIIFLPHALYSVLTTGSQDVTPFLLYPIAVNGYERALSEPFSKTFSDFLSKPFYYIIGIRIINFAMTMSPVLAVLKFSALFINIPIIQIQKTVDINQIPWIYHFLLSMPGALSTLVYAFASIGLYRLYRKGRNMLSLVMLPIVFAIIYWGWIKAGIVNDLLQAAVPLLIMVAVNQMKSKKWIYLSLAVMIIEGLIFWYVYIGYIPNFVQSTISNSYPDANAMLAVDSINRVLFH